MGIDVQQIDWDEQIKENVSVSGSLTLTGSVKINDTIDLHEDGYLDLKKNGFIGPQSVMINDPNSAFIGAHWIKVARRDTGQGNYRPMSGQTSHSVFLMTFAGREGSSDYATRSEFLVTVKFSPTNSGSPHYLSSGTHVTVEPLDSSDLDGWDPTSYIALSIENNSYPAVELWVRSSETHKHLYCTYLGGNNSVRKSDGSLDYVNPALELLTGQSPASSITSLGNEVYGRWAEKVFNKVGIGTNTPNSELDVTGDVRISNHLALNCNGTTDPSGSPPLVNHAHIYSKLVSGHAELFVQDSNSNVTQISPHSPEGEWQYFSKNIKTGKVVRINMEKMIRKLEEITGESFMEEWYE